MRDFRDAKAMAQTLRAALAAYGHKISVSQSLELVAKAFGVADWNTLSAAINADPGAPPQSPYAAVLAVAAAASASTPESVRLSPELTATLGRAVADAKQRSHDDATLEHLLLALIDDRDASAVMKACNVDLDVLRRELSSHLDNALKRQAIDEATPTVGFQRAIQRATIHVRAAGRQSVTGANLLVALFSEPESRAVQLLDAQSMTRVDAVNFIAHGIVKRGGDAAA
jgi:hypothetical protein